MHVLKHEIVRDINITHILKTAFSYSNVFHNFSANK